MLVATVTAPLRPASATTFASRSCCLALRTVCGDAALEQLAGEHSLFSTETVPTSTGWPFTVPLDDVLDDGVVLRLLGAVDEVGLVLADHRPVGRDGTTPSL
jgi:hypothetical protein